jgi:predicted nucleic acid-binding protein
MKYLLDTNVFREVGKTEPHENVSAWLASVNDAGACDQRDHGA